VNGILGELKRIGASFELGESRSLLSVKFSSDFPNRGVTKGVITRLSRISGLRELDLGYTNVTDAHFPGRMGFRDLESLTLSFTTIGDISMKCFACCRKLRVVRLEETRVGHEGPARIPLGQLRILILTGPCVDDRTLKVAARFGTLERLVVGGVRVTDRGLAHLHEMKNLKELTIYTFQLNGNQKSALSNEALSHLQDALPHCEMRRVNVLGRPLWWPEGKEQTEGTHKEKQRENGVQSAHGGRGQLLTLDGLVERKTRGAVDSAAPGETR
jgi:hypothetical protein